MVHAQSGRPVMMRFAASAAALVIGLGIGGPLVSPARAATDPAWRALVDAYAADYPAVCLNYDVEVTILADIHGRISTRTKYRVKMAIFDVKRAEDYLNLVFPLYDEKVKSKKAWVIEEGADTSGTAEGGDFNERTIFGKWKELRVSIPGLRKQGYATVEIEKQGSGGLGTALDYARDIPLKRGTFTLHWPKMHYAWEYLDQFARLLRGNMHMMPGSKMAEDVTAYEVKDVPARFTDPKVPESSQPRDGITFSSRYVSWKNIADAFSKYVDDVKIPKTSIKGVRDTLKDASPREAVEALARFLDDPGRLRLDGDVRGGILFNDIETALTAGKATAFTKVVLACRLLRALKIDATVVLAASRYRTDLDWRAHDLSQIDAALVWIPSISKNFLWDVAERGVPLGKAGSDLYPEMLVLDEDAFDATRLFPVHPGSYKENRWLDLTLDDAGSLDGALTCRFDSFPIEAGLDPWNRTMDLDKALDALTPLGAEFSEIAWKEPGPPSMRCTPDTPAVLHAELTHEAAPAGDTGWEVAPFFFPLPRDMAVLGDPDREAPLLLSDTYQVTDSVRVAIGSHHVTQIPEGITTSNRAGSLETTWEETSDGVVALRKLTLWGSTTRLQDPSDVASLCAAWRDSRSQVLRVD